MPSSFIESFNYIVAETLSSLALFMPKILGALTAFSIGAIIATILRNLALKVLEMVRFSKLVTKTPLQMAFADEEFGHRAEEALARVFYWLVMLVVIYTSLSILGLQSLTHLIQSVINYVPRVISSIMVMAFGLLLAGWVESMVKGSIRTFDPRSGRVFGKIAGYVVVGIALLSAISELGIASEFITILFVGFVGSLSLGIGLAMGLGGKDLVKTILLNWYEQKIEKKSGS